MKNDYNDIVTQSNIEQSDEVMVSMGSALVGYLLGGPMGAIIANSSLPIIKLTTNILEGWLERKARRMSSVVDKAIFLSGINDTEVLLRLQSNTNLVDDVVKLLQYLFDTDTELDMLFSVLLSKLFQDTGYEEEQRLIILGTAIKGLNKVQLSIIVENGQRGGQMSADEISSFLSIPEWELRNAVRDLELRGIITDNDTNPTVWYLRELGQALVEIRTINYSNDEK